MTGDGSPDTDRFRLNRKLTAAVRKDDIVRIETLIEAGADVNEAAPGTGYTPLMWTMSAEATRTLLRAGASVHARDRQGHTALMWVKSVLTGRAGEAGIAMQTAAQAVQVLSDANQRLSEQARRSEDHGHQERMAIEEHRHQEAMAAERHRHQEEMLKLAATPQMAGAAVG